MADIDIASPGSSSPALRSAIQQIMGNGVRSSELQFGDWSPLWAGATVDLGSTVSRNVLIQGTGSTISSFGTSGIADHVPVLVRFADANTLANGANLILPTGANIATAAGDVAIVVWEGSNVWRVVSYCRANGRPLVALQADADANLTGGFTTTSHSDGAKSSGSNYKPAPGGGNMRHITCAGAFTLQAPDAAGDFTMSLHITNVAGAGTISVSGFTKVTGDDFTTTVGDKFIVSIAKHNGSVLAIKVALQ